MGYVRLGMACLMLLLTACRSANVTEGPDTAALAIQCDSLTTAFMGALKGELMLALEGGYPAHAVAVCKEMAPALAAEYSTRAGFTVKRISDRPRNPGNAPAGYEQDMLARLAASGAPSLQEWVRRENSDSTFVYLKGIRVVEPCLTCHGSAEDMAPEVTEILIREYPDDQATGYAAGDFRGAVLVTYSSSRSGT